MSHIKERRVVNPWMQQQQQHTRWALSCALLLCVGGELLNAFSVSSTLPALIAGQMRQSLLFPPQRATLLKTLCGGDVRPF